MLCRGEKAEDGDRRRGRKAALQESDDVAGRGSSLEGREQPPCADLRAGHPPAAGSEHEGIGIRSEPLIGEREIGSGGGRDGQVEAHFRVGRGGPNGRGELLDCERHAQRKLGIGGIGQFLECDNRAREPGPSGGRGDGLVQSRVGNVADREKSDAPVGAASGRRLGIERQETEDAAGGAGGAGPFGRDANRLSRQRRDGEQKKSARAEAGARRSCKKHQPREYDIGTGPVRGPIKFSKRGTPGGRFAGQLNFLNEGLPGPRFAGR